MLLHETHHESVMPPFHVSSAHQIKANLPNNPKHAIRPTGFAAQNGRHPFGQYRDAGVPLAPVPHTARVGDFEMILRRLASGI